VIHLLEMRHLFLVDYENSCHNFAKYKFVGSKYGFSSYINVKVILFASKATVIPEDILSNKEVLVERTLTEGPEAADISLTLFACQNYLHENRHSYNCDFRVDNFEKIWIVKGQEKGYAELMARLQVKSNKFGFINYESTKTLCDYLPEISCVACKLLFSPNSVELRDHRRIGNCPGCKEPLICAVSDDKHRLAQYNRCFKVDCFHKIYLCCIKSAENLAHARTHPSCTCGCDQYFLNQEALNKHLEAKKKFICFGADCGLRFATFGELKVHSKATDHIICCPLCMTYFKGKNLNKHMKKCSGLFYDPSLASIFK
jgi:hypothetical protein